MSNILFADDDDVGLPDRCVRYNPNRRCMVIVIDEGLYEITNCRPMLVNQIIGEMIEVDMVRLRQHSIVDENGMVVIEAQNIAEALRAAVNQPRAIIRL